MKKIIMLGSLVTLLGVSSSAEAMRSAFRHSQQQQKPSVQLIQTNLNADFAKGDFSIEPVIKSVEEQKEKVAEIVQQVNFCEESVGSHMQLVDNLLVSIRKQEQAVQENVNLFYQIMREANEAIEDINEERNALLAVFGDLQRCESDLKFSEKRLKKAKMTLDGESSRLSEDVKVWQDALQSIKEDQQKTSEKVSVVKSKASSLIERVGPIKEQVEELLQSLNETFGQIAGLRRQANQVYQNIIKLPDDLEALKNEENIQSIEEEEEDEVLQKRVRKIKKQQSDDDNQHDLDIEQRNNEEEGVPELNNEEEAVNENDNHSEASEHNNEDASSTTKTNQNENGINNEDDKSHESDTPKEIIL